MEQHCIYYRRKNGVKERQRKRESPRALKGRSGKYRQMLEDVPEVFSLLQFSHTKKRKTASVTMTHTSTKYSSEASAPAINEVQTFMLI